MWMPRHNTYSYMHAVAWWVMGERCVMVKQVRWQLDEVVIQV